MVQLRGLDVQPALTYLANSIALAGREVPYSTITAIDFQDQPPLGPFLSADGKPAAKLARRANRPERLGGRAAEGQGRRSIGRDLLRAGKHDRPVARADGQTEAGGDRKTCRRRGRPAADADRPRPDGQGHDRRLGPAVSAQAGPYQDGRRPLLAAVRRHAQGVRLACHGPKTVGKPLRTDDLAPRRPVRRA